MKWLLGLSFLGLLALLKPGETSAAGARLLLHPKWVP